MAGRTGLALLLAGLLSSCASGARGWIVASEASAPVSLTSSVYGADGALIGPGRGLIVIDQFRTKRRFWSVLLGLVPLSGTWDASGFLNEKLASANGVAIVNLQVTTRTFSSAELALVFAGYFLPVIPNYVDAEVSGDIVALEPEPDDAAPDDGPDIPPPRIRPPRPKRPAR